MNKGSLIVRLGAVPAAFAPGERQRRAPTDPRQSDRDRLHNSVASTTKEEDRIGRNRPGSSRTAAHGTIGHHCTDQRNLRHISQSFRCLITRNRNHI